jgi:hypothetical protein
MSLSRNSQSTYCGLLRSTVVPTTVQWTYLGFRAGSTVDMLHVLSLTASQRPYWHYLSVSSMLFTTSVGDLREYTHYTLHWCLSRARIQMPAHVYTCAHVSTISCSRDAQALSGSLCTQGAYNAFSLRSTRSVSSCHGYAKVQ